MFDGTWYSFLIYWALCFNKTFLWLGECVCVCVKTVHKPHTNEIALRFFPGHFFLHLYQFRFDFVKRIIVRRHFSSIFLTAAVFLIRMLRRCVIEKNYKNDKKGKFYENVDLFMFFSLLHFECHFKLDFSPFSSYSRLGRWSLSRNLKKIWAFRKTLTCVKMSCKICFQNLITITPSIISASFFGNLNIPFTVAK